MRTPQDFGGISGVLNTSMVIVTCLYIGVGFFGYLKYGNAVKVGSITLNLPHEDMLVFTLLLFFIFSTVHMLISEIHRTYG